MKNDYINYYQRYLIDKLPHNQTIPDPDLPKPGIEPIPEPEPLPPDTVPEPMPNPEPNPPSPIEPIPEPD